MDNRKNKRRHFIYELVQLLSITMSVVLAWGIIVLSQGNLLDNLYIPEMYQQLFITLIIFIILAFAISQLIEKVCIAIATLIHRRTKKY